MYYEISLTKEIYDSCTGLYDLSDIGPIFTNVLKCFVPCVGKDYEKYRPVKLEDWGCEGYFKNIAKQPEYILRAISILRENDVCL